MAFLCDGGASFQVQYEAHGARVTTAEGSWLLPARRSSIGRKFMSDTIAFIQDEDRAVLTGLDGGPFRNCRQQPTGLAARR